MFINTMQKGWSEITCIGEGINVYELQTKKTYHGCFYSIPIQTVRHGCTMIDLFTQR